MKFLIFLFFICLSGSRTSAVDYDGIVDKLVDGLKERLVNESKTTVQLPDYTHNFEQHVLFFPVEGKIHAEGVTLGDLTTLRRYGSIEPSDIDSEPKIGYLSIMATFSLDLLLVKLDKFKLDFPFVHIDKPVNIRIEANRFTLMIKMYLEENTKKCKSSLGFAMVDHLGDFQVTLGDSGFFSPSVERVDDIILDWLVPDIENALNDHIRPYAIEEVEKYSQEICSGFL